MTVDFEEIAEADSRMTWALDPPIPNEFTLILSGLPAGHGVGSRGTHRFASMNGIWGFGVLKWILGAMVLCSRDKMDLMILVMPEAPSE
jgi:hypothetical protein